MTLRASVAAVDTNFVADAKDCRQVGDVKGMIDFYLFVQESL
jgi:hypothetical protein